MVGRVLEGYAEGEVAVLLSEVDQEGLDEKAESENQSIRLFWKK